MELDGSLQDPAYVATLPSDERNRNQNVFPFSLAAAALAVNLMLRYLLAQDWWPLVKQQDQQFVVGTIRILNEQCKPHCSFRERRAQGDAQRPPYLIAREPHPDTPESQPTGLPGSHPPWLKWLIDRIFWNV